MRYLDNVELNEQQANVIQCINKKCLALLPFGAVFCLVCGKKQIPEPRKRHKRTNDSGTVYKLKGHRRRPWIAEKDGVPIGYFETKSEAEDALNPFVRQKVPVKYNWTFRQVYEGWNAEHFRDLKSEKGVEGYQTAYKHYQHLSDSIFRELDFNDFQGPIDAQIKKGRGHSSCNKMKQLIGQMCKWAIREKIPTVNYGSTLKLPEPVKKSKAIFSKEERERIHEAAAFRDEAKLVEMMIGTGVRIGELFTIETNNVFEKHCIGGIKSEAGRNRIIPIKPEAREWFAYFKQRASGKSLLIEGYDGNRKVRNFRNRDYYQLLDDLGISREKTPHTCRRTFATIAYKNGMDRKALQDALGHASFATTTANDYIITDEDIAWLVNAVEEFSRRENEIQTDDDSDINVEDLIGPDTDV